MNFLVPAVETHTGPERLRVTLIGYQPDIMSGKQTRRRRRNTTQRRSLRKLVLEYVTRAPESRSRTKDPSIVSESVTRLDTHIIGIYLHRF